MRTKKFYDEKTCELSLDVTIINTSSELTAVILAMLVNSGNRFLYGGSGYNDKLKETSNYEKNSNYNDNFLRYRYIEF